MNTYNFKFPDQLLKDEGVDCGNKTAVSDYLFSSLDSFLKNNNKKVHQSLLYNKSSDELFDYVMNRANLFLKKSVMQQDGQTFIQLTPDSDKLFQDLKNPILNSKEFKQAKMTNFLLNGMKKLMPGLFENNINKNMQQIIEIIEKNLLKRVGEILDKEIKSTLKSKYGSHYSYFLSETAKPKLN